MEPGSSAQGLGPTLEQRGFIHSERVWRYYLKTREAGACLKAGRFEISRSMTMPEIMEELCGVPLVDSEPFTIIEGWRIREIDGALTQKGWAEAGAYTEAASDPSRFELPPGIGSIDNLEGLLFPDTYQVEPENFDIEAFIQRQLEAFERRFLRGVDDDFEERNLRSVVIMASLVQREEPEVENMAVVAGVLWKRLDNQWNLGVDATSRYTLEIWNDRAAFLAKLRDPRDPYNTRLQPGLPPTPIGNPGVDALRAALEAQESPYWYYLHDSRGQIHLSRSAREHEAFRRRYNVY